MTKNVWVLVGRNMQSQKLILQIKQHPPFIVVPKSLPSMHTNKPKWESPGCSAFTRSDILYMHRQTWAHTQRPAASWACCTCAMQSAADKLHNTAQHSGSSVPWKMSRMASSHHRAPLNALTSSHSLMVCPSLTKWPFLSLFDYIFSPLSVTYVSVLFWLSLAKF